MNELHPGELPLDKPAKAHCGWFAVSEEALRMIERTFDREGARRKAKACFITLLRIANLEGSKVFIRTIAQIAKDMSYGYSEASKALKLVEATGLCTIEQRQVAGTKELAPSQYTVSTLLGENSATLGAIKLRLGERSKSSVSPRITNNSSKNELRTSQEPERVHRLADTQPDSQNSSGSPHQVQSSKPKTGVSQRQSQRETGAVAEAVAAAWNETPGLPRIRNLSDKRKRALAARTKDVFFVENFREAIAKIAKSSFCLGENNRNWRANLDWFLNPDTVTRIIEGQYDDGAAWTDLPSNLVIPEPGTPTVDEVNRAAWEKRMAARTAREAVEAEHFPSP